MPQLCLKKKVYYNEALILFMLYKKPDWFKLMTSFKLIQKSHLFMNKVHMMSVIIFTIQNKLNGWNDMSK